MSLKRNLIANYLGQGWIALMGIVFVPSYIQIMGMESYGLIGIFAMLQAWLALLDMGITPTLTREIARYTAGAHSSESIANMLRSLEVVVYSVAAVILCLILSISSWLSVNWLKSEGLSSENVAQAILVMGGVIALRFIEGLYRGAMLGLQKQVWLSVASSVLATLRSGGAVLVLVYVSPTIDAFLIWQGLVSAVAIIVFILSTYYFLPCSMKMAKFSIEQLKAISKFASGMMATAFLSLLLMQIDKIILSKMLSLEHFGYYTLAGTLAAVLYQLTGPVTQAYYPKFTELLTRKDSTGLIHAYHQGAQLISVLVIPAALMLAFFGDGILLLWTENAEVVRNVAPLLKLLALGTLFNGLMHIPYILTIASGWPGFAVRQNIVAVMILVPAIIFVVPRFGAIGAAWLWLLLNVSYVLIATNYLYKRLLGKEKMSWYLYDVILPLTGSLSAAIFFWFVQPTSLSKGVEWFWFMAVASLITLATVLSTSMLKHNVTRMFFK